MPQVGNICLPLGGAMAAGDTAEALVLTRRGLCHPVASSAPGKHSWKIFLDRWHYLLSNTKGGFLNCQGLTRLGKPHTFILPTG